MAGLSRVWPFLLILALGGCAGIPVWFNGKYYGGPGGGGSALYVPHYAARPRPQHRLAAAAPKPATPDAAEYTVPATAMPWRWQRGGLNSAYKFGLADGTPPVAVELAKFGAGPGQTLTIRYTSGEIRLGPGTPPVNAGGYAGLYDHGGVGLLKKPFPSSYMHPYPINLGELVGTFTTADGRIVGTPFAIGDATVTQPIPAGAKRLQLGINDDIYGTANAATANSGSLTVQVSVAG